MKRLLGLCFAVLLYTPVANAQHPSVAFKATMERTAGDLVRQSLTLMEGSEIDKAVGNASAALDIARELKDADMVMRVEKLLAVMRAVNVVQTAIALKDRGQSVPPLHALGCSMAREAAKELRALTVRYTGGTCEHI